MGQLDDPVEPGALHADPDINAYLRHASERYSNTESQHRVINERERCSDVELEFAATLHGDAAHDCGCCQSTGRDGY